MKSSEVRRAIGAASSIAGELGLHVDETVLVHNSNRIAVRLIPCDVLARVGPSAQQDSFAFEVDVAHQLAVTGSPVGQLDPRVEPRVYLRDDFVMSLWTYYTTTAPSDTAPADYADALKRLHTTMRQIDLEAPRFVDQVAGRQRLVADPEQTPDLSDVNRELLSTSLSRLSTAITSAGTVEQLLHGEPHPGNVLGTRSGPLFIDLATCCRGPIEYDLAFIPENVREHYPGADTRLIHQCNALMWAMFATQRWWRNDQYPDRSHWRTEGLNLLRAALDREAAFGQV
jgi:hypothetical protein